MAATAGWFLAVFAAHVNLGRVIESQPSRRPAVECVALVPSGAPVLQALHKATAGRRIRWRFVDGPRDDVDQPPRWFAADRSTDIVLVDFESLSLADRMWLERARSQGLVERIVDVTGLAAVEPRRDSRRATRVADRVDQAFPGCGDAFKSAWIEAVQTCR